MEIHKITKHKDGSATMQYSLSYREQKVFQELAKKMNRKYGTRFTNEIILKALKDKIKEHKK